ncbi:MAG: transposase, partial [Chlamydiae bacterium]|nr:transposase [Chlamydiota bacterium]
MKSKTLTFTYQTRFSCDENMSRILDDYADLMSRVERTLFADIAAGKSFSELKSPYLVKFGITARQFNAIRVQLEGKIASLKELLPMRIQEISSHIKNLEKKISKIKSKAMLHQKKRSLASLKRKLSSLQTDKDKNKVRICFGSKKLFRAQFALEENGYTSHEEWLSVWKQERNDSFFCLGSKDETSGNQSCSAILQENGNLLLRLRLP